MTRPHEHRSGKGGPERSPVAGDRGTTIAKIKAYPMITCRSGVWDG
jgi:hypothetical protein